MEELGEHCFFNNKQTDTFYKIVGIKDNTYNFCNFIVQECYLELFTTTIVAIDPDNTKQYKYVEVYEKKPFGRKKQMNYKLFKEIFPNCNGSDYRLGQPFTLHLSDKYCYKDII